MKKLRLFSVLTPLTVLISLLSVAGPYAQAEETISTCTADLQSLDVIKVFKEKFRGNIGKWASSLNLTANDLPNALVFEVVGEGKQAKQTAYILISGQKAWWFVERPSIIPFKRPIQSGGMLGGAGYNNDLQYHVKSRNFEEVVAKGSPWITEAFDLTDKGILYYRRARPTKEEKSKTHPSQFLILTESKINELASALAAKDMVVGGEEGRTYSEFTEKYLRDFLKSGWVDAENIDALKSLEILGEGYSAGDYRKKFTVFSFSGKDYYIYQEGKAQPHFDYYNWRAESNQNIRNRIIEADEVAPHFFETFGKSVVLPTGKILHIDHVYRYEAIDPEHYRYSIVDPRNAIDSAFDKLGGDSADNE